MTKAWDALELAFRGLSETSDGSEKKESSEVSPVSVVPSVVPPVVPPVGRADLPRIRSVKELLAPKGRSEVRPVVPVASVMAPEEHVRAYGFVSIDWDHVEACKAVGNKERRVPREWTKREVSLIEWFRAVRLEGVLPTKPFWLNACSWLSEPSKYYEWMESRIRRGPMSKRFDRLLDKLEELRRAAKRIRGTG